MSDITTQPTKPFLYKTADRGLAAALMALGFEIIDVEPSDTETLLTFPISRMLLDAADAYLVDTLSVSAHRMGLAFERLEDITAGYRAAGEIDIDDL